jgi:hypothetical protein
MMPDESGRLPRGQWVLTKLDLTNPPKLTPEQRAELAELEKKSDDDIDFSDIPRLTEEFWKRAVRNPFHNRSRSS